MHLSEDLANDPKRARDLNAGGSLPEILTNVREAAPDGAPVSVAEPVVPGPDTPHFAKLFATST